jgi:hypothetical protein
MVIDKVKMSTNEVGGRVLNLSGAEYVIRGLGYLRSLDDLATVAVGSKNGTPVLLRDLGRVSFGPDIREGVAEWNGEGETVGGIIVMRQGMNALNVINGVKQKLREIAPSLPPGVQIMTGYDRSDLIDASIKTQYTTCEDFCRVFSEELDGLYQLSFLLTGDREKAEQRLLTGLEDCYRARHVFRHGALSWAKRSIIRNAIRELWPRPHRDSSFSAGPAFRYTGKLPNIRGSHFKIEAVLALEDLERFVFVISVLERYSDRDCAVLLCCSLLELRQARTRAILHVVNSGQTASRRSGEEVATVTSSTQKAVTMHRHFTYC